MTPLTCYSNNLILRSSIILFKSKKDRLYLREKHKYGFFFFRQVHFQTVFSMANLVAFTPLALLIFYGSIFYLSRLVATPEKKLPTFKKMFQFFLLAGKITATIRYTFTIAIDVSVHPLGMFVVVFYCLRVDASHRIVGCLPSATGPTTCNIIFDHYSVVFHSIHSIL